MIHNFNGVSLQSTNMTAEIKEKKNPVKFNSNPTLLLYNF